MIKLFVYLLVAFICGSLGAKLAGVSKKGCITSIILGFIGAMLGGFLSRHFGIGDMFYYHDIPLIWTIVGSALFVAIINLISGKK
ncbi:MAG: GlsB/YeaQ/YmgE family stress response membrane protein [bacterium]|nr:GlsB/YeaQ/YmgE family stress response membrane protein [bacterium]